MSGFEYTARDIPACVWIVGGIIFGIIAIVSIILISLSFSYVEYNELAFKKNKTTNEVDNSQVYTNGRYFWGVGYSAFTFPSTAITESFTDDGKGALSIFTEAGLSVKIECSFQYRLIPEELADLFDRYGISYGQQVVNIARSILKNVAPGFTTEQYYSQRKQISETFKAALTKNLHDQAHVEVLFFQLRKITFSTGVANKLLQTLVQNQINLQESYLQNATLIRKQTVTLQEETLANVTRIQSVANADASLIKQQADTNAFRIRLQSKQQALGHLFDTLGFNTTQLKLAFLYSTGLGGRSKEKQTKVVADLQSLLVSPA